MKSDIMEIRGVSMHVERYGQEGAQPVVLLHGFTGSAGTWRELIPLLSETYDIIAIDLIGHGRTDKPAGSERYQMNEQIADLHGLMERLGVRQPVLAGYSMGGRLAVGYAAAYPDGLAGLVLESSSPGLRTEDERSVRRESDAKLADRIETEGMEKFVEYWEDIPLFASQKNLTLERRLAVRRERLHQEPSGLANSLRGFGTGSQPSYWGVLDTFHFPVLLLTGSEDHKFENIAREMLPLLPNVRHEVIKDAGHALHVEKPVQFATMVKSYLKTVVN